MAAKCKNESTKNEVFPIPFCNAWCLESLGNRLVERQKKVHICNSLVYNFHVKSEIYCIGSFRIILMETDCSKHVHETWGKQLFIRNKVFAIMLNVTEKRSLKEFVQLYLFRFNKQPFHQQVFTKNTRRKYHIFRNQRIMLYIIRVGIFSH